MFLALLCGCGVASAITDFDRIIAIVNDDVIVATELDNRVAQVRAQLQISGTPSPPYQVLQKQVLERVIIDRLQLQVADSSGIRISEEQLNSAVSEIASANGLTLREFRDVLRRDGYDFTQFREQIRDKIRISQVRQRNIGDRVIVSDREIDNFLVMQRKLGAPDLEYHLGHILLATPEAASAADIAAARSAAQEVLARLQGGANFGEMAVTYSHGRQALNGGDIGWKGASQLPTIFASAVPNMTAGDLSEPIQSASGFHLIKLIELRGNQRHIVTQTHARHILIRPNELITDDEAETRLLRLTARIEDGENFEELARSHSDDRASAIRGGDLGWTNPGDLIPKFEEIANALSSGQVSPPFRTQFGWHVVQVIERREHDNTEEIQRHQARGQIRERKIEEEGQAWLRQLRDAAYVEYRLEAE